MFGVVVVVTLIVDMGVVAEKVVVVGMVVVVKLGSQSAGAVVVPPHLQQAQIPGDLVPVSISSQVL